MTQLRGQPTTMNCAKGQLGVIGKFEEFVSLFSFVTADSDVFQKTQAVICTERYASPLAVVLTPNFWNSNQLNLEIYD